jgi:hypothetical protein
MTVPTGGSIGAELALEIKQGADFRLDIELTDEAGAPFNTAPYTAVANLRKKPFATPVTPFVCTFPATGTLRITLSRTVTAALACGADFDDDLSAYVWDLELIKTSDQTVTPAFFGDVAVFRNI